MHVQVRAATDQGRKRRQNEDSHAVWLPDDDTERTRRGVLMVVADGMGGARAGEIASDMVARQVLERFRSAGDEDPSEVLRDAIRSANAAVHAESVSHPERGGMGSTCTALVVRGNRAYLAHVGDSRAYLVHSGSIRQLTDDHSLVAQLVRDRQITEAQARIDPRRNVVTRCVGVHAQVEVDAHPVEPPLEAGDTLVLCSDGLHGVVQDDEIASIASGEDVAAACNELVALANERGGPDNITVILARVAAD